MKRIYFIAVLISIGNFFVFAQTNKPQIPIRDPDVFYKMSWKDEKQRLDNFANRLKENNKIGIITIEFSKDSMRKIKIRLARITSYLCKTKGIKKDQFDLVVSNNHTIEKTMYWILNKSEISENKIYDYCR